jgi:hypothetical protein
MFDEVPCEEVHTDNRGIVQSWNRAIVRSTIVLHEKPCNRAVVRSTIVPYERPCDRAIVRSTIVPHGKT